MKSIIFHLILLFSPVILFSQEHTDSISKLVDKERLLMEILLDSSNDNYIKGNYLASFKYNIEILEKALLINDPNYIYKGYRYLGYDYLFMKDTVQAERNFRKAIEYAKISGSLSSNAEVKMDLANLYADSGSNFNKVLNYHKESILLYEKAKDTSGLVNAYFNTIISCVEEEEFELAYPYIVKISNIKSIKDDNYIIGINNFWASYYLHKKEYEKANLYSKKTIDYPTSKDYPPELAQAYNQYSMGLAALNKYKEAYKYTNLYQELYLENILTEESVYAKSIVAKYQLEQYQKDIKKAEEYSNLQEQIAQTKNKQNNFLILVCILGLLLIVILYFAYQKRKELNKALRIKNQEYLEAKQKSEHLAKAKSNFFSTISHELRTPLYGVIGLSSILLEDERLNEHKKDLKSLKFSADYLLALINDVLQINKIDANNAQNDEITFNLKELIISIISSFEYIRLQNQNIINLEIEEEVPVQLVGNSVRISQVLMNLIGNACKFTENGTITIRVKPDEIVQNKITLKFEIEDTGIGIPKEMHATIFDEFTQAGNLNNSFQGSGLGLPIVKKLLDQSGAEISIKSEVGKGTTFTFTLGFNTVEKSIVIEQTQLVDSSFLNGKRVLIAEDNKINQIVTKKILEKKGIECTIAANGDEVITKAKENVYDLILMDLNMPTKNGYEATIAIRKFNKEIPIIALTALEVKEVQNEIYIAGMNGVLIKPFDNEKLIKILIEKMTTERNL